jgi:hypothetical protein
MKCGDTEFEIEGATSKNLEKKIDYLYDVFKQAIEKNRKSIQIKGEKKITRRGGAGRKPPFYKANIQRIIDEEPEWLVEKDTGEVAVKLRTEYGVPGANETQVGNALIGFFRKGSLTRREEKGKYLYSVATLKKANK